MILEGFFYVIYDQISFTLKNPNKPKLLLSLITLLHFSECLKINHCQSLNGNKLFLQSLRALCSYFLAFVFCLLCASKFSKVVYPFKIM